MMSLRKYSVSRFLTGLTALAFLAFAAYLYCYSLPHKPYSVAQITFDLMWLDAWLLFFLITLLILFFSRFRWKLKAWLVVAAISVYGFIAISLILDGTLFGYNAFLGDQTFRQAMMLKFMKVSWFGDFFYRGLPSFYPPMYYGLLSLYGRLFSLEVYELLKTGSLLIYTIVPTILYYAWSRLVSPQRALLITVSSIVICGFAKPIPFASPPAFIGNLLFIPWWLYFVEQLKRPTRNWRFSLTGG